jgi:hypothetical protein
MRQVMTTVTPLAAFGAMMATAQAEILHGGPLKNGNQCFNYCSGNDKDGRFGTWGACPKEASVRPSAAPRLLPSDLRGPDRQLQGVMGCANGSPSPAHETSDEEARPALDLFELAEREPPEHLV